jgi:hypothetical protein
MKFLSPIPLTQYEFKVVETLFYNLANPIVHTFPYFGEVRFIPVRVQNRTASTFVPHFIGNKVPLLDMPALHKTILPYVYTDTGTFDRYAARKPMIEYSATYDTYVAKNIKLPDCLENGDIILCSHMYPDRLR